MLSSTSRWQQHMAASGRLQLQTKSLQCTQKNDLAKAHDLSMPHGRPATQFGDTWASRRTPHGRSDPRGVQSRFEHFMLALKDPQRYTTYTSLSHFAMAGKL